MSEDRWVPFSAESQARRNDPELKAKVSKVVKARQDALNEASALLNQAYEILKAQSHFVGDAIYTEQVNSVGTASFRLNRSASFASRDSGSGKATENDNYLGNLAAGQLGVQIQKMGDEFPL